MPSDASPDMHGPQFGSPRPAERFVPPDLRKRGPVDTREPDTARFGQVAGAAVTPEREDGVMQTGSSNRPETAPIGPGPHGWDRQPPRSPRVEILCPDGPLIRINAEGGQPLVTIGNDGKVTFALDADVDEAARLWWDAVGQMLSSHEVAAHYVQAQAQADGCRRHAGGDRG